MINQIIKISLLVLLISLLISCEKKKNNLEERERQLKQYQLEKNYQKAYQIADILIFELEESGGDLSKKHNLMFERAKIAYFHLKQLEKPYKTFKMLYKSNYNNKKELLQFLTEISRVVEPTEFPEYAKELLKISFNKNLFLIIFDEFRKRKDFFSIDSLLKDYSNIDELWLKKIKLEYFIDQKKEAEAILIYKNIDFIKISQTDADEFHISIMFLYESMGDYKKAFEISSFIKSDKYSDIILEKNRFYNLKLK